MTPHKIRFRDEVGRPHWPRSKPQVRDRHRSGFFGIVNKIGLSIVVRILSDDLDRVFVGADRTVRTESIKNSPKDVFWLDRE